MENRFEKVKNILKITNVMGDFTWRIDKEGRNWKMEPKKMIENNI